MTVCSKGRINFPLLFLAFFAVTFSACRKAEDTVGNDFVGDIVGFDANTVDTSTIVAYTTWGDSIVNSLTRGMYYFYLGAMNDRDLGTTKVSPVVQFSMPTSGNSFDISNVTVDSVVLQIKYVSADSYYGNQSTTQQLKVYELTEVLTTDSGYATNRGFKYDNVNVIGSWQGNFAHMGDSVKYTYAGKAVSLPPHLRIKLDNPAFIQKFKDAKAHGAFSDNKSFQSYFKGLIIRPEFSPTTDQGCLAYVHLRNGTDFGNIITSVVLYYDSIQKIEFPIYTESNVKAAAVEREYSVVIPIQPSMGGQHKDVNYVQSIAGLKTRILIPNLFDYVKDKNIAITDARLIVPIVESYVDDVYEVPDALRLDESDSLGVNNFSTDLLTDGTNFYGGTYNSSTKQYTFTISNRIQYLFKQYKQHNLNYDYGFNLYVPTNPATASRVVIDTRPGKIKLKLSYTVIH